jgi:hypothetical protein
VPREETTSSMWNMRSMLGDDETTWVLPGWK